MPAFSRILGCLMVFGTFVMSEEPNCYCYKMEHCSDVPWAKYQRETGVYWAWASPCSGSCSRLPDPLPYGWRFATPAEWAQRPMQPSFFGAPNSGNGQIRDQSICSAHIFDPRWDHCDLGDYIGGYVVSTPNNHNYETLLVHDCPDTDAPTPAPTCKDPCSTQLCDVDAASGQRECTADGIEVDPFKCGGFRCGKVKCADCGTVNQCTTKCENYILRKGIKENAPDCAAECQKVADDSESDYVCFQRCQFGNQPICREMCSKSYCADKGDNQLCSAQDMLVDPKGEADTCGTSRCDHCGAQGKCVALCEAYNLESGDSLKCAAECKQVAGYKCFNEYTDEVM